MKVALPPGVFVLDENLSSQLAEALRLLDEGTEVYHITKYFDVGTDDVEYLPEIGKAGAFLLTRDIKQRRRPAELEAYKRHGVGAFILGGKNLDRWDLAKQLVLSWHLIKEAAEKTNRPFAYKVRQNGGRLEPLFL